MKSYYLFPNALKLPGWLLFIPGIILGLIYLFLEPEPEFLNTKVLSIYNNPIFGEDSFFTFINNNLVDEIAGILIIIGGLLVAFSREKNEDELIARIRLESLVWATYVNYAILILAIIFIYDMLFFWVLVFNIVTIIIFFIIRFNWALYKFKTQVSNEE